MTCISAINTTADDRLHPVQLDMFGEHDAWPDAAQFLAAHQVGMRNACEGREPTVHDVRRMPPYIRYYMVPDAYYAGHQAYQQVVAGRGNGP